jgi:hypothetical protein
LFVITGVRYNQEMEFTVETVVILDNVNMDNLIADNVMVDNLIIWLM